jgi:histidine triad (HIT) family protein
MPAPEYDAGNVFARILRGELPAHRVFEDERTLAFMDIMPRSDGHTLVIPKSQARNIFDISPQDLAAVIATTQKVSLAVRKAFGADGVTLTQANEAAGGQEVFHLHFHVLPRWDGKRLKQPAGQMEKPEILAANAEKIRAALAELR